MLLLHLVITRFDEELVKTYIALSEQPLSFERIFYFSFGSVISVGGSMSPKVRSVFRAHLFLQLWVGDLSHRLDAT